MIKRFKQKYRAPTLYGSVESVRPSLPPRTQWWKSREIEKLDLEFEFDPVYTQVKGI